MRGKSCFLILLCIVISGPLFAGDDYESMGKKWAIGAAFRSAAIPFAGDENVVNSFVPLLFYRGNRFFFSGLEGGYTFYKRDYWRASAIGRLRFFDIPQKYQNQIQGDDVHWGLQARFYPWWASFFDVELMTEWHKKIHANFRAGIAKQGEKYSYEAFAELKLKTKNYNSYYYGLTMVDVNGGAEMSLGLFGYYHVISNLYLFGQARLTFLDKNVRNLEFVDRKAVGEVFAGFGFSDDGRRQESPLRNKAYLRLAHGWATPSSLNQILHGKTRVDPYNNQLTSLFYGVPLTDRLFGLPLDIYLATGFVWHWSSSVQPHSQEVDLAMKFYYTIPWPIRWKLGAAEGWSYVNKVPYQETVNLESKDYMPSNLLNYLDFSIDFNLGDILGGGELKKWWLGYGIHHRSGIFETAQLFGRIKGGSNYNTIYLQYHFD